MKRFLQLLSVLLLTCALVSFADAKPKKKKPQCDPGKAKIDITCPTAQELKAGIKACPDTGCGTVDPLLNKQKNIENGDPQSAEDKDFQYLAGLPEKVAGYKKIGDPRKPLTDQGEGKMIRIVAYALAARKGSKESCNCGLTKAADTDNHIVLVDKPTLKLTAKATPGQPATPTTKEVKPKTAAQNTLKKREAFSETAEFTPRVRLNHPNLAGARLQALISKAPKGALLVRVTGVQMYDSEHAVGCHKLLRHNDWEIHPVFHLEYCTKGKTCAAGSDANWVNIEQ